MKTVLIVIFIGVAFFDSSAQSIKLKSGGSIDFPLKSYTTVYDQEVEKPSFGAFYNLTFGFILDASVYFWSYQENRSRGFLFFGFNFEKSGLSTEDSPIKYILGENISQYKYTPYLGYGNYMNSFEHNILLYGFLGVSIKKYEGKAVIPAYYFGGSAPMSVTYSYGEITAIRFGAGLDFEKINDSKFFISLNTYYDWGVAKRGNAEGIYLGEKVILTPEGETAIDDKTLYFSLTLGYKFDFSPD